MVFLLSLYEPTNKSPKPVREHGPHCPERRQEERKDDESGLNDRAPQEFFNEREGEDDKDNTEENPKEHFKDAP